MVEINEKQETQIINEEHWAVMNTMHVNFPNLEPKLFPNTIPEATLKYSVFLCEQRSNKEATNIHK